MHLSHAKEKPKTAYKTLVPPILLSSEQPCKVGETKNELLGQNHPGNFIAEEGLIQDLPGLSPTLSPSFGSAEK